MVTLTQGNGKMVRFTEMEFINGQMETNTKGNGRMIIKTVTALIPTLTETYILETG
jgi:hypothetical protein